MGALRYIKCVDWYRRRKVPFCRLRQLNTMESRRNKRDATTGTEVVAPQLTEFVFNVRGYAMPEPVSDRSSNEVICAYEKLTTTYEKAKQSVKCVD
jgi:hypothetical protein